VSKSSCGITPQKNWKEREKERRKRGDKEKIYNKEVQ
jgi:hypothetical protein